jgi:leucyl aminopeptidase
MKISLRFSDEGKNWVRIVPVFSEEGKKDLAEDVPDLFLWEKEMLQKILEEKIFEAKVGRLYEISQLTEGRLVHTVFMGLGPGEEISEGKCVRAIYGAYKVAMGYQSERVEMKLFSSSKISMDRVFQLAVDAIYQGAYRFDKYKTDKKSLKKEHEVCITGIPQDSMAEFEKNLEEASLLARCVSKARDLVNEPANAIYPKSLAKLAKEYGKGYGFLVEVKEAKEISELGMHAFLEVAKGSKHSPRLIVMRYMGDPTKPSHILGLVGKGLTYDSGGYSIKPSDSMAYMKSDMAGSAAVIGAMCAISEKKLKLNVVAVVAACENLISGEAFKPGDIIGSMAGKTIEVLNTDAEGRLTLADAIHYAIAQEKVSKVVDIATLTGAVVIALGDVVTGAITNDEVFYQELLEASKKSGEKFWQLPSYEEYKELLKSDLADLKNIGGRSAGTITAGLFIGEFVGNTPWIHLDIAGTSYLEQGKDTRKGATGVGVKTLYYLAKNMQSE